MSQDLSQSWQSAANQIESIKTYNDTSKAEKQLKKLGNSASKASSAVSTQLNKVSSYQKRYLKEPPTSTDQMLNLFGITSGSGSETVKYLRKKLLETSVLIEPQVREIITSSSIKALGCSQDQTYKGFSRASLKLNPLPTQPVSQGIYIPLQSIDLFGNLKNSPTSPVGSVYYEHLEPSVNSEFKPFSYLCGDNNPAPECGKEPFPMNKELYRRMDSQGNGKSFYTQYGENYKGSSGQDLFDFQYTKTNGLGITGDFIRVALIDRENGNSVIESLKDYYSTIRLTDPVDIGAQIVNFLSGAIDIKAELGANQINNQTKFATILQRILGLCFDDRREIDVSGISKVAELDGVDDSFFELTEVDLRNIDNRTNLVQNGVMEFIDCDNVKVPVDANNLVAQLTDFRNTLSAQTTEQQVSSLESIIDSISQNPEWKLYIPTNFDSSVSINKNIIKQLPLCVAAAVLTPKVLLPIYTLLSATESSANNTYNQYVSSANTIVSSGNTNLGQVNNIINDGADFLKKFKSFSIEAVSKIGEIYLKTLFELLKRDIVNLVGEVIIEVQKSRTLSRYAIILQITQMFLVVGQLVGDYRKCKSLVDDILLLLRLINGAIKPRGQIPFFLQAIAAKFRAGTSPEGMTINTIQFLQELGVPTGTLPDGTPNLMNLYQRAIHKGHKKDVDENGVNDSSVIVPPLTGGILQVSSIPR